MTVTEVAVWAVGLTVAATAWFFVEAKWVITSKRRGLALELPRLLAADETQATELLSRPLFAPPEGDDAGPMLNARLNWNGASSLVPTECDAALRRGHGMWPGLPRGEFEACDTKWLTELRRFGRWSLTAGPRSALAAGPRKDFGFPNFMDVQQAAKIHLILATDRAQAAEDVRHFARLFMTQEYMVCAMVGLAVLQLEEQFWVHHGKRWSAPALTESECAFLRCYFKTAVFALNPLAEPALMATVVEGAPSFRRRMLMTEQAFAKKRTELPSATGGGFENARWELAHPFEQDSGGNPEILSQPAQLGGMLVKRFAPARYDQLLPSLQAADGLPAERRWDDRRSELSERMGWY